MSERPHQEAVPQQSAPDAETHEEYGVGENVTIDMFVVRHGDRKKEGELTDLGRRVTVEQASEYAAQLGDHYDAVKAVGSDVQAAAGAMGRARETAHIYGTEIAREKGAPQLWTREVSSLSYLDLKSPVPYDHKKIYDANMPPNADELPDAEKLAAAEHAQNAVVEHVFSLHTPEAEAYKKEIAGAYSYLILRNRKMAHRLKGGSKVLVPTGTHGGMMEFLFEYAVTQTTPDGVTKMGISSLSEIGGPFNTSEGFNISIKTDENGEDAPLTITFLDKSRPRENVQTLDETALAELAAHYLTLHPELPGGGELSAPEEAQL